MWQQILQWLVGPLSDFQGLRAADSRIVNVRTPEAFRRGPCAGPMNILLQKPDQQRESLPARNPFFNCCGNGSMQRLEKK